MAGNAQLLYRGLTTAQVSVGVSAITHITMGVNILGVNINFVSGGTLYMMGASNAVATAVSLGVFVPSTGLYIDGAPELYLVAGGAAATVHITKWLGAGFTGQY